MAATAKGGGGPSMKFQTESVFYLDTTTICTATEPLCLYCSSIRLNSTVAATQTKPVECNTQLAASCVTQYQSVIITDSKASDIKSIEERQSFNSTYMLFKAFQRTNIFFMCCRIIYFMLFIIYFNFSLSSQQQIYQHKIRLAVKIS